jgi:M6 family metalloprotease-like protein
LFQIKVTVAFACEFSQIRGNKMRKSERLFITISCSIILLIVSCLPINVRAEDGESRANVVVVVSFKDDTSTTAADHYQEIESVYNGATNSLADYISKISCGKLTVHNLFPQISDNTFTPYISDKNSTDYDSADGDYEVAKEVLSKIGSTLSLHGEKADYLNSGYIDNLTLVVVTKDDASVPTWLASAHKNDYGASGLGTFIVIPYYQTSTSNWHFPGIAAHEYLHTLGFPDLYRNAGDTTGDPVGIWDIMGGTANLMQFPLSFFRSQYADSKLSWTNIETVAAESGKSVNLTLEAVSAASSSSETTAYKITTPLDDSQSFYIEYREKNSAKGYEYYLPKTGLIVYRIDPSIEDHTNVAGGNYAYLFRKNTTAENMTTAANDVREAAIATGESFGNASIGTGTFQDSSIFYADGTNSGIVIDQVLCDETSHKCTFRVTFPDYSALDIWETAAKAEDDSISSSISAAAYGSDVFLAYSRATDTGYDTVIARNLNDSAPQVIKDTSFPKLFNSGDNLYLAVYGNSDSTISFYQYGNGTFGKTSYTVTNVSPSAFGFLNADGIVYYWIVNENTIHFYNITKGSTDLPDITLGNMTGAVSAEYFNGKIYVTYAVMAGTPHMDIVYLNNGSWSSAVTDSTFIPNISSFAVCNGTLYCLMIKQGSTSSSRLYGCTAEGCSTTDMPEGVAPYTGALSGTEQGLVMTVGSNSNNLKDISVYLKKDGTWNTVTTGVLKSLLEYDVSDLNSSVYIAGEYSNSIVVKKRQFLQSAIVTLTGTTSSYDLSDTRKVLLYKTGLIDEQSVKSDAESDTPSKYAYSAVSGTGSKEETFQFENVPTGVYYLAIAQNGKHATRVEKVEVKADSSNLGTYKIWLYGDTMDLGEVSQMDAIEVLKYSLGRNGSLKRQTDGMAIKAADVDGNGSVEAFDAIEILKYCFDRNSVFKKMK